VAAPIPTPDTLSGGIAGIDTRGHPEVAVDNSSGPYRGTLYIAYQARASTTGSDKSDIFNTKSTDGGRTWSDPRAVNNGPGVSSGFDPTTSDNFEPAVAVSPQTGHILVSFYDW
jgi:Neuraminidase (sialidase)